MEYLSTTAVAQELQVEVSELFYNLKSMGWIDRQDEKWILTDLGQQKGGLMKASEKFGQYIVWPETVLKEHWKLSKQPKLINATSLGKHFNISSQRMNLVLSEMGWIEKATSGWVPTKLGKVAGGRVFEHDTSGSLYVMWPEEILKDKSLNSSFQGANSSGERSEFHHSTSELESTNYREKFEAKYRTKDGHYVRSRAEVIIDNTLYEFGLVHAYEKQVPVTENLVTDFYLPEKKVYIEFWGLENDPSYQKRRLEKLEIYKKYDLSLIELNDADLSSLDDYLPKKLLKFDIKVY